MVMAFELVAMLAALALGFVLGRIWEIGGRSCATGCAEGTLPVPGAGSMAGSEVFRQVHRRAKSSRSRVPQLSLWLERNTLEFFNCPPCHFAIIANSASMRTLSRALTASGATRVRVVSWVNTAIFLILSRSTSGLQH